jgi:glycosyltransferase involved in cell wall biosynthesis
VHFADLPLHPPSCPTIWRKPDIPAAVEASLAENLASLVVGNGPEAFRNITQLINERPGELTLPVLMSSPVSWQLTCETYRRLMPHASFLHFFWAWRALFGGLFSILTAPIPAADVYHTISTGYAGLLAARAAAQAGAPAIITEHGIYTNERRVEILMAEWIRDTVDKGVALHDRRIDLRDIWMQAFEAHSLICYEACAHIVTLYEDNQRLQLSLGARRERLRIIPNGIDVSRFEDVAPAACDARPTIALIGRVVPIKDVKTFIECVAQVRAQLPDLRALVLGPCDEDPRYYEECKALVRDLDLTETVEFTGPVNVKQYMPLIQVVVLTSLSEAQPLVLLEAGAAGIPCVATDVGSCREIIEGRLSEEPKLGSAGEVVELVNPAQAAGAVIELLSNRAARAAKGSTLRDRVRKYYASENALQQYRELYESLVVQSAGPSGPVEA